MNAWKKLTKFITGMLPVASFVQETAVDHLSLLNSINAFQAVTKQS